MSDETGAPDDATAPPDADAAAADAAADDAAAERDDGPTPDAESDADEVTPVPGLSDDGILLFFAAAACLLSAAVAYSTGLPDSVAVLGTVAGLPAAVAFVVDVRTDYVPGSGVELLVGGAAVVGALLAVPGRYYATIATLLAAAALVLWRVFDVEVRGEER